MPGTVRVGPLNRLIGRELELASARDALLDEHVRLLTLTGPPGTGKTRLAMALADAVAADFPDGVYFADLAPLTSVEQVPDAVLRVLGLADASPLSVRDRLERFVHARQMLLVLDNFEHLLGAVPVVVGLLNASLNLKVVVTSRVTLRTSWEHQFGVPPLGLPPLPAVKTGAVADSVAAIAAAPAVALFVARARAVRPNFHLAERNASAVAAVCRRLDGLPLAIELAAAHCHTLSPAELLARIETNSMVLATRDAEEHRHGSLGEAIEWSVRLLSREDQLLLRRLAVFSGGWTVDAAESVCSDDELERSAVLPALERLVEASMVQTEDGTDGLSRFRFLETLREHAHGKLRASKEEAQLRTRHLDYYCAVAEQAAPALRSSAQRVWLDRLEDDLLNLRAALDWSAGDQVRAEHGLRLASSLWRFWSLRGHINEGRARIEALLGRTNASTPTALQFQARWAAAFLTTQHGDLPAAHAAFGDLLTRTQAQRDRLWTGMAHAMHAATAAYLGQLDPPDANVALDAARRSGEREAEPLALLAAGLAELLRGNFDRTRAHYLDWLRVSQENQDHLAMSTALMALGHLALVQDDRAAARRWLLDGLASAASVGSERGIQQCLEVLGWIALADGSPQRAAGLLGAAQTVRERLGVDLDAPLQSGHSAVSAALREALDPAVLSARWEQGRHLTVSQAVALGLDEAQHAERGRAALLTHREREVVVLVARGLRNREIAAQLVISERTAEGHLEQIRQKLRVHTRRDIASWAQRQGLDEVGGSLETGT